MAQKNYEENPKAKRVAELLIKKYPLHFSAFKVDEILFLLETDTKPKKYAEVRKVTPPYTYITDIKFIMTVYEQNTIDFSGSQYHALIFHELLHIDETFTKLVKHDLEDFKEVISMVGVYWDMDENIQDILKEDKE